MRRIVTCGIPRSGSTLVWQILQAIFPRQRILKTHPDVWEPDGSIAVVSIRDPRDVVASLLRVRSSRNHRERNRSDLENVLHRTARCFDLLGEVVKGPHTLLRYEHFYKDHAVIFDAVTSTFGVRTPPHIQSRISAKFSLEANRNRSCRLLDFNFVDEHGIHGDHIGQATPGYGLACFDKEEQELVMDVCKPIMWEWGYA